MTKDERKANRAAWAKRIADFRASGLSATQWCAANGLKIHQLRYWLKKLKLRHQPQQQSAGCP